MSSKKYLPDPESYREFREKGPGERFSKARKKISGPEKPFLKYEPLILKSCYFSVSSR